MFKPLTFLAYALALSSKFEPSLSDQNIVYSCKFMPGHLVCENVNYGGSMGFDGIANLDNTFIGGSLSVNGIAKLSSGTIIDRNLVVNGILNMAETSVLYNCSISGSANVTNSYLLGSNEVHGSFHGKEVRLGDSRFYSDSIAFYQSTIQDIAVISDNKKARVCVLEGTNMESITFPNNNGLVYMDASSKVAQITGGKVENVTSCPV